MRSEVISVTAFVIYDATRSSGRGKLDPITVILRDFGGGGQIMVECFGAAWAHWFGAIGGQTLPTFLVKCEADYLADKLMATTCRVTSKKNYESERGYVKEICAAILRHMNGGTP